MEWSQWGQGGGGWPARNLRISAWITHGCGQRDISRFINSSNADWKPPYAINGTYGGVRGGRKSPYSIKGCCVFLQRHDTVVTDRCGRDGRHAGGDLFDLDVGDGAEWQHGVAEIAVVVRLGKADGCSDFQLANEGEEL